MIKLMKYEFRRNLTGIVGMLGAILLLQAFFLFAAYKKDVQLVMVASMLLFVAASVCVLGMLIYSVALYSRELGSKTSYLTFMTPNPVARILGSKLISALILGVVFAAILGLFATWDFSILSTVFPELEMGQIILEQMLQNMANTELSTLITTVLAMLIEFLINFFTIVVVAYLAITLSATVLQNKKFKGFVSIIIFFAIMAALEWGTSLLTGDTNHRSLQDALFSAWPKYAVYLVVMSGSFVLSTWLLDNKVSL